MPKGYVHNDSLGVKFFLYAQRHDWFKIFPLGIKAILAILRQSMYDSLQALQGCLEDLWRLGESCLSKVYGPTTTTSTVIYKNFPLLQKVLKPHSTYSIVKELD